MTSQSSSRIQKFSHFLAAIIIATFTITIATVPAAHAQASETILYSLGNKGDEPHDGLVFDASGNLFGTAVDGGATGRGSIFELSPVTGGGWRETVVHSFDYSRDGAFPIAGLVFDKAGNLYGATSAGGPGRNGGVVFELSPQAGGGWRKPFFTTLEGRVMGLIPGLPSSLMPPGTSMERRRPGAATAAASPSNYLPRVMATGVIRFCTHSTDRAGTGAFHMAAWFLTRLEISTARRFWVALRAATKEPFLSYRRRQAGNGKKQFCTASIPEPGTERICMAA